MFRLDLKAAKMQRQSIFKPNQDIKTKLNAALIYVQYTCVFGSANKLGDVEKTNAWTAMLKARYFDNGQYINASQQAITLDDIGINLQFNPEIRKLIYKKKNWYYHTYDHSIECPNIHLYCHHHQDPLADPKFNLKDDHLFLLKVALLTQEKKQGNCLEKCSLLIKHLWEHWKKDSSIKRLEIISTNFDHVFVMVNRISGTLDKPDSWCDDAWIVDPWYGDNGIIYPAREFQEKINEILQFHKMQSQELRKVGIPFGSQNYPEEISIKCDYDINLSLDQYPTYSTAPFYPLEYYYGVSNSYPEFYHANIFPLLDDLTLHKEKLMSCLSDIKQKPCSRYYAVGAPVEDLPGSQFLGGKAKNISQQELEGSLFYNQDTIKVFISYDQAKEYAYGLQENAYNFSHFPKTPLIRRKVRPVFTLKLNLGTKLDKLHTEIFKYEEYINKDNNMTTRENEVELNYYSVDSGLINKEDIIIAEFYKSRIAPVEFTHKTSSPTCVLL